MKKRSTFEFELTAEQEVDAFMWINANVSHASNFVTIGQVHPEKGFAKFAIYNEYEFKRMQALMHSLNRNRRRKEPRAERLKKVKLFFGIIKPESEGAK